MHVADISRNTHIFTSAKEYMSSSFFVCLSVWLLVCLLATLRKNFCMDLHEIFRESWQWASEQMVKFWWRFGSPFGYKDCFPIRHYWQTGQVVSTDAAVVGMH